VACGRRTSLRPRTWAGYESIVRVRIIPALGRLPLDKVEPQVLQAFASQLLTQGLSVQSVQNTHPLLHRSFADAVKWGLLGRNPCDLVDLSRASRLQLRALTAPEVARLLATCADDPLGPLVTVAVLSGLRLDELLALQWGDIDWERSEPSVVRSLQRVRGQGLVVVPPKTAASRRRVPLSPLALEALRRQRRHQVEWRLAAGPTWAEGDWVFTSVRGVPLDPAETTRRFHRLLERAGLPHRRFHDLRHTTASLLLADGVHPKVVASILGHSTVQVTLDVYSRVTPGLARQAAERLQQLVANSIAHSALASREEGGR
jgi:integrase